MAYQIVVFAWRKPGLSPEQFKEYYDNSHIPLILSLAGSSFPLMHRRNYIQRVPTEAAGSDHTNATHPAVALVGEPKDFDYDAYAELTFENADKFQEFMAKVMAPDAAAQIAADEEKFLDRPKLRVAVIDQNTVTSRPS